MNWMLVLLPVVLMGSPDDPVDPVNKDKAGVALHGYDPVAYFTEGAPVEGSAEITYAWNGATWHFADTAHRDLFAAEPEAYAPQFGGYCAWAVSRDYTADVDPTAWKIVDGKLYLNYNLEVKAEWEKEFEENIRKGRENWPGLHKQADS
jgi:YHS domain-containing protein